MLVQRLTSFLSFLPVSSDDVDDTGDAGATRFTVLSNRKKKPFFGIPLLTPEMSRVMSSPERLDHTLMRVLWIPTYRLAETRRCWCAGLCEMNSRWDRLDGWFITRKVYLERERSRIPYSLWLIDSDGESRMYWWSYGSRVSDLGGARGCVYIGLECRRTQRA